MSGVTMSEAISVAAAIVREAGGPFVVETLAMEQPRADEVLVRIVGVGLCHTDLICRDQVYPVPLPAVLGHEGAGVIETVGADITDLAPGDHVVLSFNACGACENCLAGLPSRCLHIFDMNFSGTREDGSTALCCSLQHIHGHFFGQSSFAGYAIAGRANTVKIDPEVPLEMMGPLGCGIQTGAGAVLNSLKPEAGSSLAVFGCGAVGLSGVMAAHICGCTDIVAIDPNAARRELAQELGAHRTVNPATEDPVALLQTNGGIDYALECTGIPSVFRQSVDCLKVTGCAALVGAAPMGTEVSLDMNSIMFGRTVKGVIEGDAVPTLFIPRLVELYKQGRLPLEKLVRFYPLSDIQQAVHDAEQGLVVKPVLLPWQEELHEQ